MTTVPRTNGNRNAALSPRAVATLLALERVHTQTRLAILLSSTKPTLENAISGAEFLEATRERLERAIERLAKKEGPALVERVAAILKARSLQVVLEEVGVLSPAEKDMLTGMGEWIRDIAENLRSEGDEIGSELRVLDGIVCEAQATGKVDARVTEAVREFRVFAEAFGRTCAASAMAADAVVGKIQALVGKVP